MKLWIPIALVVLAALGMFFFYREDSHRTYSLETIEVASTPEAHERGLSERESIPDNYGMLFIFRDEEPYAFWMKDMLAPIDIIWLENDGSIAGILDSVATSTYPDVFYPPHPIKYVLEIRAGLAREKGWATTTKLSLPLR